MNTLRRLSQILLGVSLAVLGWACLRLLYFSFIAHPRVMKHTTVQLIDRFLAMQQATSVLLASMGLSILIYGAYKFLSSPRKETQDDTDQSDKPYLPRDQQL